MYLPDVNDGERMMTPPRSPHALISERDAVGTIQTDRDDLQVKVERKYINETSTGPLSAHRLMWCSVGKIYFCVPQFDVN